MSEDDEKPRRRRSRGDKAVPAPVPEKPVDPDDIARSEVFKSHTENEKQSAELLKTLNLHHRHGYGEYNNKPEN